MMQRVKIPDAMNWARVVDEIEMAVEDTGMIAWVGSRDGEYRMPWDSFKQMQVDTEYHVEGGYCALAGDLVVVLDDDSWYEYDQAAEEWIHRWAPTLQGDFKPFDQIVGPGWCSLAELNADD